MAISTVNAFPVHSLAELSELEQQQMLCSIQSLSVLAREESALFDLHGKDAFQHLNKLVFSPFEKVGCLPLVTKSTTHSVPF